MLLKQAIDSCLKQTYRDFHILISDDSPDTDSLTMVESHEGRNRITYLRNSPLLGQAANVNRLFELCEAEYLVLLHDDDLLFPTALECLIKPLQDDATIVASFGRQSVISNSGEHLAPESKKLSGRYYRTDNEVNRVQNPLWSALVQQFPNDGFMVRAAQAKKTRYRDRPEVGGACDVDFGLRLAQQGKFFFVGDLTAAYRISDESESSRSLRITVAKTFLLLQALTLPKDLEGVRTERLKAIAQTAVTGLLLDGKRTAAARILFSKYYRAAGLGSKRGISQLLALLVPRKLLLKFIQLSDRGSR